MDPSSDLPPGLKPPGDGEFVEVTWWADLGAHTRVGQIADHLHDLGSAVDLGERWGLQLAREAAFRMFLERARREGPRAVDKLADRLGYSSSDIEGLREWIEFGWWPPGPPRRLRSPYWPAATLLEAAADVQLPRLFGRPAFVEHLGYNNPIEVVLGGSGLSLVGITYVLRLVRDWSNQKREGAARADLAEAAAREGHARAEEREARADCARWLVDELKAGRIAVPPSDLLGVVTHEDTQALDRLAQTHVRLQLPEGIERPPRDRDPP